MGCAVGGPVYNDGSLDSAIPSYEPFVCIFA